MLVLTRKRNESIMLGEDIKITVLDTGAEYVKLGIDAPKELRVLRSEVYLAVMKENAIAARVEKSDVEQLRKLQKKPFSKDLKSHQ